VETVWPPQSPLKKLWEQSSLLKGFSERCGNSLASSKVSQKAVGTVWPPQFLSKAVGTVWPPQKHLRKLLEQSGLLKGLSKSCGNCLASSKASEKAVGTVWPPQKLLRKMWEQSGLLKSLSKKLWEQFSLLKGLLKAL
jgi:hypothetical protein